MKLAPVWIFALISVAIFSACSGPQNTEIKQKAGGGSDDDDAGFSSKPEKAKHDSLGQLAMAAADFVELERVIHSLLRQDLTQNSAPGSCPRRKYVKSSDSDDRVHFFTLKWNRCGRQIAKTGYDCVRIRTKTPDDLSTDSIEEIVLNPLQAPVPLRSCEEETYYRADNMRVLVDTGLRLKKKSSAKNGHRFQFERNLRLLYQRKKKDLLLEYSSEVDGRIFVPKAKKKRVSYYIRNFNTDLVETQTKSTFNDSVVALAPDDRLQTQKCGFLMGSFRANISSDRFDEDINDQSIQLTEEGASSPMTNTVVRWPRCRSQNELSNVSVITTFFRRFKKSQ